MELGRRTTTPNETSPRTFIPSSPTSPPIGNITIRRSDEPHRLISFGYTSFAALSAAYAHATIDAQPVLRGPQKAVTRDLIITCDFDIEDLPAPLSDWIIRAPHDALAIDRIRNRDVLRNRDIPHVEPPQRTVKPTPIRPPSKPRQALDGYTPLSTICEQHGIDPRAARAALRSSNTPKPSAGWQFMPDEIPHILTIIKPT